MFQCLTPTPSYTKSAIKAPLLGGASQYDPL